MSFESININIGILGHVDCGKTSLARVLSTSFSTASIDKSKQEKERGITIDLGFSSFSIDINKYDALKAKINDNNIKRIQFTLVDCPGHSSLIKTIIGGAQIIDFMLLVIDINKGIETQTGECIVLGECLLNNRKQILIVLNKCDLFKKKCHDKYKVKRDGNFDDYYNKKLNKKIDEIRKVFKQTKFGKNVKTVCVSANVDGTNRPGMNSEFDNNKILINKKSNNIDGLINRLIEMIKIPNRNKQCELPFLALVDHCFNIKGQGTALTMTILQGKLKKNDIIEIPNYNELKKVKTMQIFKKDVDHAISGDRVSISISQFQSKKLNRGLIAQPNTVKCIYRCIARIDQIRFFKGDIESFTKYHITIGHTTTEAKIHIFKAPTNDEIYKHKSIQNNPKYMDFKRKQMLKAQQNNNNNNNNSGNSDNKTNNEQKEETKDEPYITPAIDWEQKFDYNIDYIHLDYLIPGDKHDKTKNEQYCLLTFAKPVYCSRHSILIGSKIQKTEQKKNVCRLAFKGKVVDVLPKPRLISVLQHKMEQNPNVTKKSLQSSNKSNMKLLNSKIDAELQKLKVYKPKQRMGSVQKFLNEYQCIGKGLFTKHTNLSLFYGLNIELSNGILGHIETKHGEDGYFIVKFKDRVTYTKKWKPKLFLKSRKFVYQKSNLMTQ